MSPRQRRRARHHRRRRHHATEVEMTALTQLMRMIRNWIEWLKRRRLPALGNNAGLQPMEAKASQGDGP